MKYIEIFVHKMHSLKDATRKILCSGHILLGESEQLQSA